MICYFSACIFFLFQSFLPDFSGILVLGFLAPFTLLSQVLKNQSQTIYELSISMLDSVFPFVLLSILFFFPGMMPAEFLDTIALIMVVILTNQFSKEFHLDSNLTYLAYMFSIVFLWLSSGNSIGLSILALFFILKMNTMLIVRILFFILLSILSLLILYFNHFEFKLLNLLSVESNFPWKLFNMDYQFLILVILFIFFLFRWLYFYKQYPESTHIPKIVLFSLFYFMLFIFQSWIFSVFIFFSSLPRQSQSKK